MEMVGLIFLFALVGGFAGGFIGSAVFLYLKKHHAETVYGHVYSQNEVKPVDNPVQNKFAAEEPTTEEELKASRRMLREWWLGESRGEE
jgi:hypothetical protein